jgi:hypothetical protein
MTKKKPGTKAKVGRPSKFDTVDLTQVEKLAKAGWTDAQMSDFFKVSEQTWNTWKGKHPEFFEPLKDWKLEADAKVERSLYERATGYSHPDSHVSNYQGEITITPITKHYAPETGAICFWLKNRKPEIWKETRDHRIGGPNGEPLPPSGNTVIILPAKDAGD